MTTRITQCQASRHSTSTIERGRFGGNVHIPAIFAEAVITVSRATITRACVKR